MSVAAPIAIGLMAAQSVLGGITKEKAYNAQAKVDQGNAQISLLNGAEDEETLRRSERATSGEAIAAEGANGVQIGTGSALDLIRQNAQNREYAILTRRYQAATEARAYQMQAKQAKSAAKSALFGGILGAGAQILTGVNDLHNASAVSAAQQRAQSAAFPGALALPSPGDPSEGIFGSSADQYFPGVGR